MKKVLVVFVVLLTLAGVTSAWLWNDYQDYITKPLNNPKSSVLTVEKGSNYNGLVRKLQSEFKGINQHYFKLYGRQSGLASQLKAGEYEIKADITPEELLAVVTSGRSINYQFTIIEGSTFKDVVASLKENSYLNDDISKLTEMALLKKLNLKESHPEGLFLAETYSFSRNDNASDLLRRANKMLENVLQNNWQGRNTKLPYKTAYEALIMASIVEKETARADERPIIAGVFVRRLNKKMRLQTDPTVIYGMGDSYKGNIRRSDLRKPTPYNTYVIPALPPTPIAMVGREAVEAALNPADGKALYFVAKGDGSHYFSKTLREHNNAVRKYQLSRRKDYRSSP